jgi:hypothetical protein
LWGGAPVLGVTRSTLDGWSLSAFAGAGFDARLRQNERRVFNATIAALGSFALREDSPDTAPTTWTTQLTFGVSQAVAGGVTFNLGAGLALNPLVEGSFSGGSLDSLERNLVVALGSVQRAGLRPLPLVRVPLTSSLALDGHVAIAYQPSLRGWVETYTVGISYER